MAEQFARGTASHADLSAASGAQDAVIQGVWSGGRSPDARAYATQAAGDAAGLYPRTTATVLPATVLTATVLSATSEAASAVGCAAGEADCANYETAVDLTRAAELSWQASLLRELVPYPGDPAAR